MKPLNLDNRPCSPISSNCVVWQGPDIPCIKLCTGDSISDVISEMATELCSILETLKVSNYDLTCFNLQACPPEDFQALIQFLIEKICELEGIPVEEVKDSECPNCVVSVADCFRTGNQTTMQLVDYVQLIGERICSIVDDITLINQQITDILIRIDSLENAPTPTFTLPTFTLGCTIGSLTGTQAIDTVLIEFINNVWCGFYAETGSVSELDSAAKQKCVNDADTQLNTGTAFSTNPNWIADANYDTLADAVNNIWVVLCDVWNYADTNPSVTVSDTNTINLNLNSSGLLTSKVKDTGWVDLLGFDWYSSAMTSAGVKPQCRRIGNVVHFRGIVYIPLRKGPGDTGVFPITSTQDYYNIADVTPATSGAGSVQVSGSSSILFNQGNSSIPTAIVASQAVDAKYRMPYPGVVSRNISVAGESVLLTGAGRFGIQANGTLYFAALTDQEFASGLSTNYAAHSALRYITSNVRAGDLIPEFNSVQSDINSFPLPPDWDANAAYTVGDIVKEGSDFYQAFVNIAAPGPNPAPSLTDTAWDPYTSKVDTANQGIGALYPFNCDAGDASQLGGFFTSIEGLVAFIDCDSDAVFAPNLDCDDPRP